MVNSSEFAKRLQKVLDYYGLSATAFSERIDFNRSTISHLLSGRNKPSLEFVMKVLNEFPEVELYWFLNGKGHFPSTGHSEQPEKITNQKPATDPLKSDSLLTDVELPNSEEKAAKQQLLDKNSEIERIVLFYKDGSFKLYE